MGSSSSSVRHEGRRSFLKQGEKELPGEENMGDSYMELLEDFSSIAFILPIVTAFIPNEDGPLT